MARANLTISTAPPALHIAGVDYIDWRLIGEALIGYTLRGVGVS